MEKEGENGEEEKAKMVMKRKEGTDQEKGCSLRRRDWRRFYLHRRFPTKELDSDPDKEDDTQPPMATKLANTNTKWIKQKFSDKNLEKCYDRQKRPLLKAEAQTFEGGGGAD